MEGIYIDDMLLEVTVGTFFVVGHLYPNIVEYGRTTVIANSYSTYDELMALLLEPVTDAELKKLAPGQR